MAVTLTKEWQNVANGSFVPGTGLSVTFWLDAKYSTQSQVNNTTTVQTRLNCTVNSGYGNGYNYSFSCSYAPTVSGSGLWTLSTETITSGESTITHNADGTKTRSLSANARINGIGMNVSFSGDAIIPRIDRYATLSSAQDFTDEGNPKITFTKNVASGSTVYAGIFNSTGTTAYASYRNINSSVSSGEYTFNLTTAERNALRNAIPNAKTMQVQFKMYTTISGTNFDGGSITKTMSITNANPTLTSPTYSEQNTKVSALLGSSGSTVVQNASTLRVGITATALKSASISKVVATHSGSTYTDTSSPYSFDIPIKANSITLTATDSRTNTGTLNITKTMLAYTPVAINTFSFKRQTETSSTIILNLSATYYQQTFGSTANAPIVKWKKDNGSWTTLTSSQYTIDNTNHKLTVSNLSLGAILDYQDEATFTIYIEDKLSTAQNSDKVTIGIPTLEMGKDDVKVNGTFVATGDITSSTNVNCNSVSATGSVKAVKGIWSRPSGEVGTATSDSNSMLLIKRASSSEAPNNGVVLEYGNSASYRGQLFIGDNNSQGIYFNGWSNGTRGTWHRLAQEDNFEKYSTSETKIGTWTDGKPVYRKVFNVSIDTTSAGWKEVGSLTYNEIIDSSYVCTSAAEPTRYRPNNPYCNLSFYNNKVYTAGLGNFSGTLYLKKVIVIYTKSS